MAHRAVASALGLLALLALTASLTVAFVLFAVAGIVLLDGRYAFGRGRHRAFLAFISAPFAGLAGVVLARVGALAEPFRFLLSPGLLVIGLSLALLGWASVSIWTTRRGRAD